MPNPQESPHPFGFTGQTTIRSGEQAWLYQLLEPQGPPPTLAATQDGRSSASATGAAIASGTVYVTACPIEQGLTITNINLFVLTAEAGGTHAWAGIADSTGKILAISADNTGATFVGPANSALAIPLATPLVIPATGLYYIFVMVAQGTTAPTFAAAPAIVHANLANVAPKLCGTTLTGQTTPPAVGTSLGTITATAGHNLYEWLT